MDRTGWGTMAGKRGNGEGSIRQRANGRWEARVLLDGQSKSLYGRTRQEVARKLAAVVRDHDKGLPITRDERQTLSQFLTTWLETVKPTVKSSTWRRYRDYMTLHVVPNLGRISLAKLTPQHIQTLYSRKLEEGLSPTTVHHLHTVLHHALDQALRWGMTPRNVTELVDAPPLRRREMHALTPEQAKALLIAARGDRWEAFYVLAITTGMRLGEALALRWRDVNLDGSTVTVRASLQRADTGMTIGTPKTEKSRRTVALRPIAVEALKQHRARQHEERLALEPAWEDNDLVFPNTIGRPMDPIHLLRRQFYPLLERAGLPRIRLHDLRHTAATLMRRAGVNLEIVSEVLGHADPAITLRIYSHVQPDMQATALVALDRVLGE
jgi:integrase